MIKNDQNERKIRTFTVGKSIAKFNVVLHEAWTRIVMGYLCFVLSVLCRLLPIRFLFDLMNIKRTVGAVKTDGQRQLRSHTFWLPIVGFLTIWTVSFRHGDDSICEIVYIGFGLPDDHGKPTRSRDREIRW